MNIAQDHPEICDEIRELSSGCNGAARFAQMYEMGTILRYGNTDQKQRHLQDIAAGKTRLQAVSVTAPISHADMAASGESATKSSTASCGTLLRHDQLDSNVNSVESEVFLASQQTKRSLRKTSPRGRRHSSRDRKPSPRTEKQAEPAWPSSGTDPENDLLPRH